MTSFVESQNFAGALREVVSVDGDRIAFRHDDRLLTYAEFGAIIEEKTIAYEKADIRRSSIVGVIADDLIEFLTDMFALLRLQTFSVLLPSDTTHWELKRLSEIVQFNHILSAAPIDRCSIPVARRHLLTRSDGARVPIAQGPCLGFLTSGTTGRLKIALRTENAVLVGIRAMGHELVLTPDRRLAAMVPLHHTFGFDFTLAGILAGAEVCSYSRMPPSAYLMAFEHSAIEVVALVPSQLRLLAEACNTPMFHRLSVMSAGAPLDTRTARLANERLGCAVGQVYGTTETGAIAVAPPREDGNVSVGKPSRHMEVRLDALPPDWGGAVPGASAEGIVAVRSEALFEGYATLYGIDRQAIGSGWFSTGDRARLVDGRFELLGRLSCAINVAGVKVSPEEVEAAILEFPTVRGVLVRGVDDSLAYQRIKAYVTPEDVDLHALRRFCETRLSASKRPHYYQAVTTLATTPSGKVIRGQQISESSVQ